MKTSIDEGFIPSSECRSLATLQIEQWYKQIQQGEIVEGKLETTWRGYESQVSKGAEP